jgi:hypothetical protein
MGVERGDVQGVRVRKSGSIMSGRKQKGSSDKWDVWCITSGW